MSHNSLAHGLLRFWDAPRDSRLWRHLWRFAARGFSERSSAAGKSKSFRIGKVRADSRGRVWYLTYHQHGWRRRPRVGADRAAARQLAAQINSQLEVGAAAALSFGSITIAELQKRWLDHHEHVLLSSVQTISRYRTATAHLVRFVEPVARLRSPR